MDTTSTPMGRYSLHFLLLLLLWPRAIRSQQVQQYCAFSPQHTMCRTTGIGPACGQNVPGRGVSSADAAAIVASHNSHRARVAQGQEARGASGPQPQAADMLEMIWDEELSLIAQRHADQCVFEHECADCRQVERFGVGQNLYIAYESSAEPAIHWDRAVQAWYDEVDLMPNTGVASYNFNPSTGHYTQLVWGSTGLVGCGYTMYEEGGWFKKLYTCNYGPAGNLMFAAMYQTGPACSACPQGTSCSLVYPGLCASNADPKGSQGGQTIEENIASFEPSSQNQVAGASRSLIRSQPEVNQLAAALNQLDLSQLTVSGLLSLLAAADAGNTQGSTDFTSPFSQLLSTTQAQTNAESLNNLQAPANIQITSNTQTPSTTRIQTLNNVKPLSRSPLTELPPHPATVALQRQRQRSGHRQSPAQQGTARPRGVSRQRVNAAGQTSLPSVVDSRILDALPSAETLNKFLINVGQDSQIIKTDSLASVRDVLSTLPAGSNPLVFFRSNMGTLRQLSDRGLLAAAAGPQTQNLPRRIRSTKPPALQQLDAAELVDTPTSISEDHAILLSLAAADNKEIPNIPGSLSSDEAVISEKRSSLRPDEARVPDSRSSLRSNASDFLEEPRSSSSKVPGVLNGPGFAGPEEMLLSCQDAAGPCSVVALAGNWTHGSTEGDNVIRSVLAPREGGQLVLGQALPPPASSAACVSLSYRFVGTSDTSPQVAISVWPRGQVLLQEDLDRVSVPEGQGWQVTRVSFAPVRNAFMAVLTVEPNPADADVEVAVQGFRVTEGLC